MDGRKAFDPLFWEDSEVLILGTIPSSSSIEKGEYYYHYANYIWDYLAQIFQEKRPTKWVEKQDFLEKHRIALWDVYAFSDVVGSSDKRLKEFNDIAGFLKGHPTITKVLLNGNKTTESFQKYLRREGELPESIMIYSLPSTSGANTRLPRSIVFETWKEVLLC